MNSFRGGVLAAAAAIALAGCHFPSLGGGAGKAPTGQVVATVGDREITVRDLREELGSATFADPKARKQAEQLALRNIIARVVLADAAKKRGLEKDPDFAVDKKRAIDTVLAQALQRKLVSEVPQPSKDEVQSFINSHSDIFLERKIFVLDQIHMGRPSDPAIVKALQPLNTLEEVEASLKKNGVAFQRVTSTFDAVGADPRMVEKIVKLPPHEIFVVPSSDGILINQIKDTKIQPFLGDPAFTYAQRLMTRQRTQDALNQAFAQIMAKAHGSVQYNNDYAPPKPTANLLPPAPAAQPRATK
jgi:EpsD family peptidyl-prolyl cis-trans isomerase